MNRRRIPTKGIIQFADVMQVIRGAETFGVQLDQSSLRVDFEAIMEAVRERRAATPRERRPVRGITVTVA